MEVYITNVASVTPIPVIVAGSSTSAVLDFGISFRSHHLNVTLPM